MSSVRHRPAFAPPSQRGVALIEVLVSILIFSFGVLGLLALEARAIGYSTDSEDRNRAAMFANEVASAMWLQNSVTLNSATLTALQTRVADPTQGGLPNGQLLPLAPVAGTTNSVDITINWKAPARLVTDPVSVFTTRVTLP